MPEQPNDRPQTLTAKDREFDALLCSAAQHSQRVAVEIRRGASMSRQGEQVETSFKLAAYAAKGQ
jgi:hypothetical protein